MTEFHNTTLNHYFITADENEKTAIRSGAAGAGWEETGQNFWAWTPNVMQESAFVCRFYGDPVKGPNSHFYSASTDECRSLLGLQLSTPASEPRWNSEGYEFKVSLPDAGTCRGGLVPIYRAYNEFFAHGADDIGIIVQGGNYNTLVRVLERLGVADVYGNSRVPLYVMNVAYPLIDSELLRFCAGKRAVLLVEEGQPNFIEHNVASILRSHAAFVARQVLRAGRLAERADATEHVDLPAR